MYDGDARVLRRTDAMVGAMMKGFNITFYDDRRTCHMLGCTDNMIAFKWDHAVRDFMDPEKRFPTLCCLPRNQSFQTPPVDECTDPDRRQEVRALCVTTSVSNMLSVQHPACALRLALTCADMRPEVPHANNTIICDVKHWEEAYSGVECDQGSLRRHAA
jgi:hypothetical protein